MGLRDHIRNNSRFVRFEDNIPVVMTIIDHKESVDSFGNDSISYTVRVQGDDKDKILQCGSVGLARQVVDLPNEGRGCKVKITRTGEKFDTVYKVELANIDLGDPPEGFKEEEGNDAI